MTSPTYVSIFRRTLVLAILVLSVPSCGSNRTPCYPVGDNVVGQGKDRTAAAGAVVVFHPTVPASGDVPLPTAHVGEDGHFALTTYVKGNGARPAITRSRLNGCNPAAAALQSHADGRPAQRPLFRRARHAKLRYTIKTKDNNMPSIELGLPSCAAAHSRRSRVRLAGEGCGGGTFRLLAHRSGMVWLGKDGCPIGQGGFRYAGGNFIGIVTHADDRDWLPCLPRAGS